MCYVNVCKRVKMYKNAFKCIKMFHAKVGRYALRRGVYANVDNNETERG